MSLNFTPNDAAGGQYHRANKIIFNNPIAAKEDPAHRSILFLLEQVTNTATGGQVCVDAGFLEAPVNDAERDIEIDLIDLEGSVLGKMAIGQLTDATLLYINSYMIHIASQQNRLA